METFFILLLLVLGVLFLVAEIVFLPGVTLGALLAMVCYGSAIYLAFTECGTATGVVVTGAVVVLSLVATWLSLRAKTWQRFSLTKTLDAAGVESLAPEVKPGSRGVAISRLAPMGKAVFDGRVCEAKSVDAYIDQRSEVEAVGMENATVIVRKINNNN